MPDRTVTVKIKQGAQTIDTRTLLLDPDDDRAVRAALLETLDRFAIEHPTSRHTIDVYRGSRFIRRLAAA